MIGRRAALRGGVAVLTAGPLAACGFRPVYMPTASGNPGPAERELAAIHVNLIPDRSGQLLRQALQARMNSDSGVAPRYDLSVTYWITGEGVAVLPDTTAARQRMSANAIWTLTTDDPAHLKIITGTARSFGGVDVIDTQYFGNDLAAEEMIRLFADQIAAQITLRLASYFRERAG